MTRNSIRAILEIVGTIFFWVMLDGAALIAIVILVWIFFGARLVSLIYVEPEQDDGTGRNNEIKKNN